MDPIAFEVGPLTVRWYGICVALGFLLGFGFVNWRAPRWGVDRDDVADVVFWAMLGGIGGARLLYVVQNWQQFQGHLWEIVRIDHGGLVYYGGFFGGGLAIILACMIKSLSVLRMGDLFIMAVPLGHAVGRIGCFLNGCCYGWPWTGACSVQYPGRAYAVFPIQLVASAMNLAVFGCLLFAARYVRVRGQVVAAYLTVYGLGRFFVEFGRGDYSRYVGPLTPAQVICAFLVPAGIVLFIVLGWGKDRGD
ncbi:MAG: prolipoprotein diacylglyceryl transferase [Candidatus Pacebacteria bacterium]|nr:prolipoprotein diacylglyceryl transferase [Candidatus Paceibacterota bacterium]